MNSKTSHFPKQQELLTTRWVRIGLIIMTLACSPLRTGAQTEGAPIRIGFTSSIFKNQNENDILAALKAWAQAIGRERNARVDPEIRIYRSPESAADAIRTQAVDALTVTLSEYADFPKGLLRGPFFKNQVNGRKSVEFVLLARNSHATKRLIKLHGGLCVHASQHVSLSMDWLAASCAEAGLGTPEQTFKHVKHHTKLSSTVLSVFFGKYDLCLVTRDGFASMVELNPQVAKQVSIVASAPSIIPSCFSFRSDFPEADRTRLLEEIQRLGETVTGKQVLRVFKADCMVEITQEEMDDSLKQLAKWKKIIADAQKRTVADAGDDQ